MIRLSGYLVLMTNPVDLDDAILMYHRTRGLCRPRGRLVVVVSLNEPPGSFFFGLQQPSRMIL